MKYQFVVTSKAVPLPAERIYQFQAAVEILLELLMKEALKENAEVKETKPAEDGGTYEI